MQRYCLVADDNLEHYAIPVERYDEFYALIETTFDSDIELRDEANYVFDAEFSKYRVKSFFSKEFTFCLPQEGDRVIE